MDATISSLINSVDWSTLSGIVTILTFLFAIIVFAREVRRNRKEREFSIFLRLLEAYEILVERRRARWKTVKGVIQNNPALKHEIHDRTNSIDYLLARSEQDEPMFAIEHGILEDELRSMNTLNEICRYAMKDDHKSSLLKALFASEISYYQNRIEDLLHIREHENQYRLFSIPRYEEISRFSVGDFFEDLDEKIHLSNN